jgi:radical SAM superfamily enzyme YgiQ (UPF0313 family)
VPFNCYLRVDWVDEDVLALLKKAGCHSVHLSVDSTSKHVREQVLKRHMKDIDIAVTLRLIRSYGIETWVNHMIAVPESTLQDDIDAIALAKKGRVTYPSFSVTVPMKGTELYDYCERRGLIDPATFVGDMNGCNERPTLPCFSEKEKDIRYNVYLLGAVISKFPFPFDRIATALIRVVPPNRFFAWLRQKVYLHYIENRIFKLR